MREPGHTHVDANEYVRLTQWLPNANMPHRYNQVYAIMTGIGTIDRMKRNSRQIPHDPLRWLDVCGVDFAWITPTPQKFKNRDTMLGYTTPSNSWTIKNTSSTDEAATDIAAGNNALLPEAALALL